MKAIHRKALRDLWLMRGQALAIALVIAAGVAMLVMSQATLDSLQDTRTRLYRDARFSDVWVQLKRAPLLVAQQLAEVDGVAELETRLLSGAKLELPGFDEPVEALVQSLPEDGVPLQNRLHLRSGRLLAPGSPDEVLVSDAFAKAHGIQPGTRIRLTVHGRSQWMHIVGVAASPEHLMQTKPGSLFPDYERFAIVWAAQTALEAALDMKGAFNQATLLLAPRANEREVIDALDRILTRYGSLGATGRMQQASYRALHEELRGLAMMAWLFPAIFLAVAAFLLNVVFKRLIGMQRDQVAILKAFGYTTLDVALHYGLIVSLICVLGTALGVACGVWLGNGLAVLYQQNFHFPYLAFSLSAKVVAVGLAVTLLSALTGTGYAVFSAAGEPVAQAMRPPAPERFRRTLLERMGLARLLSQPTRIIWRQLERRPGKALLSIIGLAFAGGIVMMGFFQEGAIRHIGAAEFRLARQYDISASFIENAPRRAAFELRALAGVHQVEGVRTVAVRLRHDNRQVLTAIEGLPADGSLRRPLDTQLRPIELPPAGVVLGDYLARRLGVQVGDALWVEVLEGRQARLLLPVARLVTEFTGMSAYMELDALNRALGDGDLINGALLTADVDAVTGILRQLDRRPMVMGAQSRSATLASFYRMIRENIGIFSWIAVAMGAIVNFGVVYNSVRMALAERARELASLRVLGFTRGEVGYILLGEQALLVLVALPLGMLTGYGLARFMAEGLQSELYRIPVIIPPSAYAICALVTVASAVLSALVVYRRIHQLDLIGVLKTRE